MPLLKALLCQILAVFIVLLLNRYVIVTAIKIKFLLLLQVLIAMALSRLVGQARWWMLIHASFLPGVFLLQSLQLTASWYLVFFILSVLIFWGTVKGDVPLFLSSTPVVKAVLTLVAKEQADSFIDIGAGLGSMVLPVANENPQLRIMAVERAPLPWLIAKWRCRHLKNIEVKRANFWALNLADYDVVFAFLSPLVMKKIADKVQKEMRNDTLFISSTFPVPDWLPETIIETSDKRQKQLFCYRIYKAFPKPNEMLQNS